MNIRLGVLSPRVLRSNTTSPRQVLNGSFRSSFARPVHSAASNNGPFRLAIIGSGPAGFYSAHRVMTRIPDGLVDMYEQYPVPFGLVRSGVAPDHPEVKNCQDKFTEIAESPRFNFIGNVNVGHHVSLPTLRENYDAVLFAYGASEDRELEIPGRGLDGLYSAGAFVGWYNGHPKYADLSFNLQTSDTAVIIGQGNVALDVARILLSGPDRLRETDISEQALQQLAESTVKKVHVVGRRGPMQASFTIKEVRELMDLPEVEFRPIDLGLLPAPDVKLPRVQKRMTDLFRKHAARPATTEGGRKNGSLSLDFMSAPFSFVPSQKRDSLGTIASAMFEHTTFSPGENPNDAAARVQKTGQQFSIEASTVFTSIGYKARSLKGTDTLGVVFDKKSGTIPNLGGRVMRDDKYVPGLYCAGWVKRGPTGVIATTMEDGFATAELIAEDWSGKSTGKHGWDALKGEVKLGRATGWQDWLKIDATERARGKAAGKEREKIRSVKEMLEIIR